MKIILRDFNYKGVSIKNYVCELPQIEKLEDIPEEKIVPYILENLAELIKEKES